MSPEPSTALPPSESFVKSRKWVTVGVLFAIAGVNYADRTAISSLFPLLRSDLGLTDVAMGAAGSLFLWSYAACSPLAGMLADRLSRSRLVFWSLFCWSLATVLMGFARSAESLLACRVLLGICESAYLPAAIALIADHHEPDTRATAMSIHIAGLNMGMVCGGVAGGWLGEHFGWRAVFFVLGGAGLALALIARLVLRDRSGVRAVAAAADEPSLAARVSALFRFPVVSAIFAEAMVMSCGAWVFYYWLPTFYQEKYQLSLAAAGFAGTAVFQFAASFGTISGGYVSDRFARGRVPRRLLLLGGSYLVSGPFLLLFLTPVGMGPIGAAVFVYALLSSFGMASEHPILCDILPASKRSTAIGLMNTLSCIAGGLGVLGAGYLKKDWGLSGIFGAVVVLVAVAMLIVGAAYLYAARAAKGENPCGVET